MIIACNNCNKKFDIDSNLIPDKGRLLQCAACNHKWFFKKEITNKPTTTIKINKNNEELKLIHVDSTETIELFEKKINETSVINENSIEKNKNKNDENKGISQKIELSKNENSFKLLSIIVIFIISFIALIIILDTFKKPFDKFFPNIEFLLYNFYETIKDSVSFLKDLI